MNEVSVNEAMALGLVVEARILQFCDKEEITLNLFTPVVLGPGDTLTYVTASDRICAVTNESAIDLIPIFELEREFEQ